MRVCAFAGHRSSGVQKRRRLLAADIPGSRMLVFIAMLLRSAINLRDDAKKRKRASMMTASKPPPTATSSLDELFDKMGRAYHMDEPACLENLIANIPLSDTQNKNISRKAAGFVETVRTNRSRFGGLDSFLQEFGLSTREGIALMCLAEALLRIPDAETADKLIREKIGSADWDQHLGKGPDLFVNASTWALMLTGKVVGDLDEAGEDVKGAFSLDPGELMGKMVSKLGEPVVRKAMLHSMRIMGKQFVMGRTIGEALDRSFPLEKDGYRFSFDMLGESAKTAEDAERYFNSYKMAIDAIGQAVKTRGGDVAPATSPGISVKLSALYPRYEYAKRAQCVPALSQKLLSLAEKCAAYNIGLTVDAEEASRLEISLEIIRNVFTSPTLGKWEGFGLALQAYQRRAFFALDWLVALSRDTGRKMMIRLVKGAYWDSEIKYAQMSGFATYPVFTRKNATDVSYLACAARLLQNRDVIYPQFATHNAHTVAAVMEMAGSNQSGFEFQRLHGMGEPLYHQIVGLDAGKYPCRVYAPVGSHEDLLPYLVRRLLENGANTSFVNRLQNDKVPIDAITANPVDHIKAVHSKPHPKIPQPPDLYGAGRKNSMGIELANSHAVLPLLAEMEKQTRKKWSAFPMVGNISKIGTAETIFNPADRRHDVGAATFATDGDMVQALEVTSEAFVRWSRTPAEDRARCLERAADLMEQHMAELMTLCVLEAGKTLPDALGEIREAVDFCRYYAQKGREDFDAPFRLPGPTGELNQISLHGRGVFLCISPWNFPLAIFMGQVAAALMAGNCVIAKPAEQTPLIAARAVEMLYEAGIPEDVLAFVPATGEMTGKLLVKDPRIAGVAFTGSTEIAQIINRTLAARDSAIAPLIAETGGQNAMIVDTSALPEQVVDDAITSAFRSAGQRCSALRVLFVQDGIADKVMKMLDGATQELAIGNPMQLSTDIGPVIDEDARVMLQSHAAQMEKQGRLVTRAKLSDDCAHGTFFAPCAFEIPSIDMLKREVFGPILHIVRFAADELEDVIASVNDTGYGLTLGVHTRIDHTSRYICNTTNCGNSYVNRSMIGAVVGVQPFGGQGLSGTGPKAGGPFYLHRFATEKTLTVNTTASGGNVSLVSLAEGDH